MSRLVRIGLMAVVAIGLAAAVPAVAQESVGDRDPASSAERRELREGRRLRVMEARLNRGAQTRGVGALYTQTVGGGSSPQALPSPIVSLSIEDDFDLGRYVFQNGTPFIHNDGGGSFSNTAVGLDAMTSLVLGNPTYYYGDQNTAVGAQALGNTMEGGLNTGVGAFALSGNTTGYGNTAVGAGAGSGWTTGVDNIAIGSGSYGYYTDSGTIRIGGLDLQTTTYIEGIDGTTVTGGVAVMVGNDDQLGTMTSSARFKQGIRDLEGVSERLLALHPVAFRYKDELAEGGPNPIEYGLVAEEVAEVFPELVVNDAEGHPYTVRYHLLAPLLLHELQREVARSEKRDAEVEGLRQQVAELRRVVAELRPRKD